MSQSKLLQALSDVPVLGVSMSTVTILRLDLVGGLAPGNKTYKMNENLNLAKKAGYNRLLSFGGSWSNHLHALAALGNEQGIETVGIVRGEKPESPSQMLCDAQRWGMQLEYVSRSTYRRRQDDSYLASLEEKYGPCLIIPEGGSNAAGVEGCQQIARLIPSGRQGSRIVLPIGTGTTMAGLLKGLGQGANVVGVSVLKGALDLDQNVAAMLGNTEVGQWLVAHDHHCGGYAKVSSGLKDFILEFERIQQIPLDPVYTGKALFAIHSMLASGQWPGNILFIHTGGLQGRRGFSWLDQAS